MSYLTARPSRNPATARNQAATREWWRNAPDRFELVTSGLVLDEAGVGDPHAARDRLAKIQSLTMLEGTEESLELTRALIEIHAMPANAVEDALHVAIAVVHNVEYLVTWNLKHIANQHTVSRIRQLCRQRGYEPSVICTPRDLSRIMEQRDEGRD